MVRHVPGYDVEWRLLDEEPTCDLSEMNESWWRHPFAMAISPKIRRRRARQRATELTSAKLHCLRFAYGSETRSVILSRMFIPANGSGVRRAA